MPDAIGRDAVDQPITERPGCPHWCTVPTSELEPHALVLTSAGVLERTHARTVGTVPGDRPRTVDLEAIEHLDEEGHHLAIPVVTIFGPSGRLDRLNPQQCRELTDQLRQAADLAERLA